MAHQEVVQSCLEDLDDLIIQHARISEKAELSVKVGLVAVGSMFATLAQFMTFGPNGPTYWQIGGIFASVVVAIGAGFTVLTDRNSAMLMASARRAANVAQDLFDDNGAVIARLQKSIGRATNTHMAMKFMRLALHRAVTADDVNDEVLTEMMDIARERIPLALGFEQGDQWTLCVYKSERDANQQYELRLVAHERAIKCGVKDARPWPAGVGVAGICFTNKREIVVPDMQAYEIGTALAVGSMSRPHDRGRYRSMIAVPVIIDEAGVPWGVVVATNDRPDHFPLDGADEFKTTEFVRALANLIALAVATQGKASRAKPKEK